jgi:hypothetical protein
MEVREGKTTPLEALEKRLEVARKGECKNGASVDAL